MASKLLLFTVQALAVSATSDFANALKFHAKRQSPQEIATACSIVAGVLIGCESATPGYTALPISRQASCACYYADATTTAWVPSVFDGAVSTCADYAATNDQVVYQGLQTYAGLCSKVGDLRTQAFTPANTPATPTTSAPTGLITSASTNSGTLSLTGIATFPACSSIGMAVASCELDSPGFTSFAPSSQAACVCYTRSTSWVPERFDEAASSCAEHVRTAAPSDYNIFSNLAGFCSDVGDIYATTATTASVRSGGGIGAGGSVFGDATSSSPTATAPRTVTVQPGAATPSSSRAFAVPTAAVGGWVAKVVGVVVFVQVLA